MGWVNEVNKMTCPVYQPSSEDPINEGIVIILWRQVFQETVECFENSDSLIDNALITI
jgi:hypothetical protein